ncbi:MAG: hypothetical protein WD750_00310 [Gammaproteobacteria bacterium]
MTRLIDTNIAPRASFPDQTGGYWQPIFGSITTTRLPATGYNHLTTRHSIYNQLILQMILCLTTIPGIGTAHAL